VEEIKRLRSSGTNFSAHTSARSKNNEMCDRV
jgi:hypothetical protein